MSTRMLGGRGPGSRPPPFPASPLHTLGHWEGSGRSRSGPEVLVQAWTWFRHAAEPASPTKACKVGSGKTRQLGKDDQLCLSRAVIPDRSRRKEWEVSRRGWDRAEDGHGDQGSASGPSDSGTAGFLFGRLGSVSYFWTELNHVLHLYLTYII